MSFNTIEDVQKWIDGLLYMSNRDGITINDDLSVCCNCDLELCDNNFPSPKIKRVGNYLDICNCDLKNLEFLSELEFVGEWLYLHRNPKLKTLKEIPRTADIRRIDCDWVNLFEHDFENTFYWWNKLGFSFTVWGGDKINKLIKQKKMSNVVELL